MKVYDAAAIRNVALVGHGGSGKDAARLRNALRGRCGQPARQRSTKARPSPTSTKKRSPASTRSPPASRLPSGRRPRSTSSMRPASPTSSATRRSALRVVEGALAVRRRALPASKSRPRSCGPKPPSLNLPRIVAVNRLERERASLERTLESLHRDCAREIIPIQLPIGEERGFTGVVDLVTHEGADVCRRRQRQDDRGRRARGAGRARARAPAKS